MPALPASLTDLLHARSKAPASTAELDAIAGNLARILGSDTPEAIAIVRAELS